VSREYPLFRARLPALLLLGWAGASAAAPPPAAPIPRRLYWDELAVDARLDDDARLHVAERHAIVFSGDWNGAERTFRLAPGQSLTLHRVQRLGPLPGEVAMLSEGSLGEIDRFAWVEPGRLRWRSRRPSDPPFNRTRIDYVVRYTLAGVVERTLRGYRLDHDFAFGDRQGAINRFTLDLQLDAPWHAEAAVPRGVVGGPLAPGDGWRVVLPLEHGGPGWPRAAAWRRFALHGSTLAALVVFPVFMVARLVWRERATGRLGASTAPPVSRADLERDIFAHPPEVIGAAWDGSVGEPEVGAVVARLVQEGKLRSEVTPLGNLSLELLVGRETFDGYDQALVHGLFVDGDTTNTEKIQNHYRALGRGFNPAAALDPEVSRRVEEVVGPDPARKPWWARLLTVAAVLAAMTLVVASTDPEIMTLAAYIAGGMVMLIGFGVAAGLAARWRVRLDWPAWVIPFFVLPAAAVLAVPAAFVLRRDLAVSDVAAAAVGFLALGVFGGVMGAARSRQSRRGLELRRRMFAARRYFVDELRRPQPALDDAWFPYLVAFGLDRQVQKWFRAHPAAQRHAVSHQDSSYPSPSSPTSRSSSSGPTWTGGGGSFGGAGASGSFVAALGGVTAGVSAPASSGGGGGSSGGGGGSGGGSSSGGGGGGGW